MRITIRWITHDWALIRRICETYHLTYHVTVNGITETDVNSSDLEHLKRGEPKFLNIINIEL